MFRKWKGVDKLKTITAIGMDGIDYEFLQASGYEIIGRAQEGDE